MNSFHQIASELRGRDILNDLPLLVLIEALDKKGATPHLSERMRLLWEMARDSSKVQTHLQIAASDLLRANRQERLQLLDELLSLPLPMSRTPAWINAASAGQIAGFAIDASSVRCAFGWSLHPALKIGVEAAEKSRPLRLSLIDLSEDTCELAQLCAAVLEIDLAVSAASPFERRADQDYHDVEISLPPFGLKIAALDRIPEKTLNWLGSGSGRLNSESLALADALSQAPNSRVVLGLPAGALFRTVGAEAAARQELLLSRRLSAVLGVPSGMIYSETGIATSLLVLEPAEARQDMVRFADLADAHFSTRTSRGRYEAKTAPSWAGFLAEPLGDHVSARDVSYDEIEEKGRILTVERYLSATAGKLESFVGDYESRPLEEVVDMIRPFPLPRDEEGEYRLRECSPADIGEDGFIRQPEKETLINRGALRKARNQQLRPGDVVLSIKGTIGRVGIVSADAPDEEDAFWTAGQSMMILRPRANMIAPEVLYEYLASDLMSEHLKALAGGSVIQAINMPDLKSLPVPLPATEQQDSIRAAFTRRQTLHAELDRVRQSIASLRAESWPNTEID